MKQNTYVGGVFRGVRVVVKVTREKNAHLLDPAFKHCNHSPDGFAWGYGGSGPAQLAFAILFDYFGGDPGLAFHYYQTFKSKVIAGLPEFWELTDSQILETLNEIRAEFARTNTEAPTWDAIT